MSDSRSVLRPSYGIDAPPVPLGFGIGFVACVVLAVVTVVIDGPVVLLAWWILWAVITLGMGASYLYTTLRGKFAVWRELAADLRLSGDERVLDLGCGRGMVLIGIARHLKAGRAVGVDLWRADQSGNTADATMRNAQAEGVDDRVEVRTGDMTKLPFDDAEFDVVVSSLAIHNIPSVSGRDTAIAEAARVLRPGGRLVITDFRNTADYARRLESLDMADVARSNLGHRFWYGAPWTATRLVTARKST